jgi:hypothetical protein
MVGVYVSFGYQGASLFIKVAMVWALSRISIFLVKDINPDQPYGWFGGG